MSTNATEDTVTTLVVKQVPPVIGGSVEQAYAYFRQYNAISVRPMEGIAMRGTVFLDFESPAEAAQAYSRLQQLPHQGEEYRKVRVEYAKPNPKHTTSREHPPPPKTTPPPPPPIPSVPSPSSAQPGKPVGQGEPIAPHLGIHYPPNPDLQYRYPDPTPEILTNMMHAIASVPRLYVQTLHLMNKMNLAPPFGPVQNDSIPAMLSKKRKHDELVASDESEIESDEEQKDKEKEKMEARSRILAAQEQKRALLGRKQEGIKISLTTKKKK
ncbi:hypothetical protein BJV82DRAFT_255100 [Fennellomyces sp. T-0311]|nr:hypothetical protein BJV82DRAFT_255100 [Fennellomyces sp. T-0311]